MTKTVRVLAETAVTRTPIKWIYTYSHPLDDCPAGSSAWEVTIREFAPGLIDYVHPRCSRCGMELFVDDLRKEPDTGFVPWSEVKAKMAQVRQRRDPSTETEILTGDGRDED